MILLLYIANYLTHCRRQVRVTCHSSEVRRTYLSDQSAGYITDSRLFVVEKDCRKLIIKYRKDVLAHHCILYSVNRFGNVHLNTLHSFPIAILPSQRIALFNILQLHN